VSDVKHLAPCRVIIDARVPRDHVELSPGFLSRAGIHQGSYVLVRGRDARVKLKVMENPDIDDCDVMMSPILAFFLDVGRSETVDVNGEPTAGRELLESAEKFSKVLSQPAEEIGHRLPDDAESFRGLTVSDVIDHMVKHADQPERTYLEVPPSPGDVGVPRGEACEDPSLFVKIWEPEGEAGKTKIFRPGGEPEDQNDGEE
jgi:hypothetical protein